MIPFGQFFNFLEKHKMKKHEECLVAKQLKKHVWMMPKSSPDHSQNSSKLGLNLD